MSAERDLRIAEAVKDAIYEYNGVYAPVDLAAIIAAILPETVGVPDGWRLVPLKPTEAMCLRGCEVSTSPTIPAEVWNAMLAAAPQTDIGKAISQPPATRRHQCRRHRATGAGADG